jgi:hypothetical protein
MHNTISPQAQKGKLLSFSYAPKFIATAADFHWAAARLSIKIALLCAVLFWSVQVAGVRTALDTLVSTNDLDYPTEQRGGKDFARRQLGLQRLATN